MTSEFKFRFTGDLSQLQASLKSLGQDLAATKKQGEATGDGLRAGVRNVASAVDEARAGAKGLEDQLNRTAAAARKAAAGGTGAKGDSGGAAGAVQSRDRDAAQAMLEVNRRADAVEQKLAATRRAGAAATRQSTAETQRATAAQREQNRQLALAAPQLTDIVTSLAGGQSPFLVAIQQGGQLRDIFGGLKPAIAGLGTAILSLVNPITVTIGVIGGVAAAFLLGREEGLRFNRILIQTGGAAGVTSEALSNLSRELDALEGSTTRSAANAIAQVAEQGVFAGEQIALVARAAEQLRSSAGRDVGETIAEFSKLGGDPTTAAIELNKKYNVLTGSVLEQIKTLQEQGRQQEAVTLAVSTFSNAINARTPQITENLGYIERGWRAIKNAIGEATDEALNFGRQKTGRERFDELFRERQELQSDARAGNSFARARISMIEKELGALQEAEKQAQIEADRKRAQARAVALSSELATDARQYEDAAQKRARIRISAENRARDAIEAANKAGDTAAAKSARQARDAILSGLAKEEAEDAKRKAEAGRRAGAAAARQQKEAARQAANLVRIDSSLVQDASERALKELDRLYSEGQIKLQDYFAEKQRLELESVDASIRAAEAQRNAAVDIDDQKQAEAELIRLQRQRAEIAPRAAREQAAAERELATELERLQARLAEAQGKLGEQERVQLEQERDALLRKFQNNPGAQELVRKLFDVELAKSRADAIDQEREKLIGKLRDETDYLNSQSELGGLSPVDAEQQLQEARQRSIQQLEELRRKAKEAYGEKPPEEVSQALKRLDTDILKVKASQEELKNAARQGATDALSQFFTDLATGAKSFKDAFKDMVRSFIQGLARMVAEALAKRIILSILGGFGGGAGTAAGTAASVMHSGGNVGQGTRRVIPQAAFGAMFAAAPRFHSGGEILKRDEFPTILQTGERVLSRQENRKYKEGDRLGGGVRVVNAFDPSFVPDQMDSAEGERVILNVLGRNPGRVRQILG